MQNKGKERKRKRKRVRGCFIKNKVKVIATKIQYESL